MAWVTSPILKPGDADADIASNMLGGGRSSRLYKKLVYEKQIAQSVSAQQYSLILGSIFQIEATARPGHTVEELEKAIEEELTAFRATPVDASEVEQARNTIETNIIGGLERLGGFGGVADRLNSYNHYLGTPDYLAKDIERYRAVTAASAAGVCEGSAHDQLARRDACRARGAGAGRASADATGGGRGAEQAASRSTPTSRGALRFRVQVSARPLQLATPASAKLANGLTLILSERRGLPIVAANLVLRTGSDANPLDKPGMANFVAAMLDEGTAKRNALQIADDVARLGASLGTSSSMDATTISARSLTKNFPATLEILSDVVLQSVVPRRRDRAAAREPPGGTRSAARQPRPGRRAGHSGRALRSEASVRIQRGRHRSVG